MRLVFARFLLELIRRKRTIHTALYTAWMGQLLMKLGDNVKIDPTVWFESPDKVSIASNCEIRRGAIIVGRTKNAIGIRMDRGVHIHQYAYLDAYDGYIELGEGVRIGHHSVIAGHGGVVFEKNSGVAGLSYVIAANHGFGDLSRPHVEQEESKKGIRIGENVWGASGVIITDGVTIGHNSVIGAGSVVRRDVPPRSVVLGNPAKVVYTL